MKILAGIKNHQTPIYRVSIDLSLKDRLTVDEAGIINFPLTPL